jgi:hypothetical protein
MPNLGTIPSKRPIDSSAPGFWSSGMIRGMSFVAGFERRNAIRMAGLVVAWLSASMSMAQPAPAPAPSPAAEPAPPKGLEALLRFDCAALEKQMVAHEAAGRYTKPDGSNAALVLGALELKACPYAKLGPEHNHALEVGASVTNEYIGEGARYAEYCEIFQLADFVPAPNSEIAKVAGFRASYCSPAPPSKWTVEDTRVVQLRVQRLPELDRLHARFDAAWQARHFDSPPGENVLELGLMGREMGYGKIREWYISNLRACLPGAVSAAEQALAAGNRAEFERLFDMISRIEPQLPDLQRLRSAAAVPGNK